MPQVFLPTIDPVQCLDAAWVPLQVWEGLIKQPAFQDFKMHRCQTVEHAQQVRGLSA